MSKVVSIQRKQAKKTRRIGAEEIGNVTPLRMKANQQPTGRFLASADLNDPDVDNLLRIMAYIQREIDRREEEKLRKVG